MKQILIIILTVMALSCAQQAKFLQGFENGMDYDLIKEAEPHRLELIQIGDKKFSVKKSGIFLDLDKMRQSKDPFSGEIKDYYTETELVFVKIPGETFYEIKNIKAEMLNLKQIRRKSWEINHKTVDPLVEILNIGNDSLIVIEGTLKQSLIAYRKIGILERSLCEKILLMEKTTREYERKRIYNSMTKKEQEIIEWIVVGAIMTTKSESPRIDTEFGCKNVYIRSDHFYILAPKKYLNSSHEYWRKSDLGNLFSNSNPKSENRNQQLSHGSIYEIGNKWYYVVKGGDYFHKISKELNIDIKHLKFLNKEIYGKTIHPGQKIRIK
jgi:hypothetical protein